VTRVETWLRDPYAIYAERILKLRPLPPPDEPIEALARGVAIHAAFERFALAHPEVVPDGAEMIFETLLLGALDAAGMPEAALVRERALARNAARWMVDFEQRRRPARLHLETRGELTLDRPGGSFTLIARSDRIEVRDARADILDFKTGRAPSRKVVAVGLAPQLTLTAAILAGGGFAEIGPSPPGELLYVQVSGGREPGRETSWDPAEAADLARAAMEGLCRLIDRFDDPRTGYASWPRAQFAQTHGTYDHLARVWEWKVAGEGGADEP
jgi:ATP-dependent helicase/nuclease subunit B